MIIDLSRPNDLTALGKMCQLLKARNEMIGIFSGAWDLTHLYHIITLTKAKRLCDYLIVGVGSDRLCGADKGMSRPIYPEHHRIGILSALNCVDACFLMDSEVDYARLVQTVHSFVGEHFVMCKPQSWVGKLKTVPGYRSSDEYLSKYYKEKGKDVDDNLYGNIIVIPDTGPASKTSTTAFIERIKGRA